MDKRYQVFVSSTYEDLKEERRVVMQVLLETNCIPAGMELFSAEDEDQWSVIKRVIDDCDYYIVIVGGRYGSMTSDGKSYTQKEYEYAILKGIPVMAFLPEDPNNILSGKTDDDSQKKLKLEEFKKILKNKMCKTWNNPDHLAGAVSISINHMIKNKPAIGWIKGDKALATNAEEVLRLRNHVDSLRSELENFKISGPPGSEKLAQGNDTILLRYTYYLKNDSEKKEASIRLTWNKIFGRIGPLMLIEEIDYTMQEYLGQMVAEMKNSYFQKKHKDHEYGSLYINHEDFTTIMIQFKSLGLITKSLVEHPNDRRIYWTLTQYGEHELSRIRAIKRKK